MANEDHARPLFVAPRGGPKVNAKADISPTALDLPLQGSRLGDGACLRSLLRRPTLLVFLRHGG